MDLRLGMAFQRKVHKPGDTPIFYYAGEAPGGSRLEDYGWVEARQQYEWWSGLLISDLHKHMERVPHLDQPYPS